MSKEFSSQKKGSTQRDMGAGQAQETSGSAGREAGQEPLNTEVDRSAGNRTAFDDEYEVRREEEIAGEEAETENEDNR